MNMSNYRKKLSNKEHELFLKFPAYISLLAANLDGLFDEVEQFSANEFAHMKTYSCDLKLEDFYRELCRNFETSLDELNKSLPKEKELRAKAIEKELINIENIMLKLGDEYSSVMHESMRSFKDHISRAHHNVLVDFLFPIPIKGLNY